MDQYPEGLTPSHSPEGVVITVVRETAEELQQEREEETRRRELLRQAVMRRDTMALNDQLVIVSLVNALGDGATAEQLFGVIVNLVDTYYELNPGNFVQERDELLRALVSEMQSMGPDRAQVVQNLIVLFEPIIDVQVWNSHPVRQGILKEKYQYNLRNALNSDVVKDRVEMLLNGYRELFKVEDMGTYMRTITGEVIHLVGNYYLGKSKEQFQKDITELRRFVGSLNPYILAFKAIDENYKKSVSALTVKGSARGEEIKRLVTVRDAAREAARVEDGNRTDLYLNLVDEITRFITYQNISD